MRITGGTARGRRLVATRASRVRPTSDRVRSALFQIVGDVVPGARVLDLYAGTGVLGMEALSRGAIRVDFVEQDSRLSHTIESNLNNLGFADQGCCYMARVEPAMEFLEGPYSLILLDPPYDLPGLPEIITGLNRPGILEDRGLVIVEHSRRTELAERYGMLKREEKRRYGDTALSMYRMEEP